MRYSKQKSELQPHAKTLAQFLPIITLVVSIAALLMSVFGFLQTREAMQKANDAKIAAKAHKGETDRLDRHEKALRLLKDRIQTITEKIVEAQTKQSESIQTLRRQVERLDIETTGMQNIQDKQMELKRSMLRSTLPQ